MPLKQRKLSFSGNIARPGETNDETDENSAIQPESTSPDPDSTERPKTSSVKPKRSFREKWLVSYPWLEYDASRGIMTCKICKEKGRKNAFTRGTSNFKTSNMDDHIKTDDHQTALAAPMLANNMQRAAENAHNEKEKGVLVAMEAAYFLASEGIPLVKFRPLINFLRRVKAANIEHLKIDEDTEKSKTLYDSSYTANQFLEALSKVLENELEKKLSASPVVTVLADESTDIAVNKRLVLYAQVTNPETMSMSTEYLTNVKLTEGTGAAIANEIYSQFSQKGVPPSKIMGLGSDGASVMTGKGKGVTGMMLRKNPHLQNVHCVAHRLALCTSQAAENLPALKDYQETITSIYYYFKYSSCKQEKLAAIEKVLDAPQLKYKEVHSVRWLSFFQALETVYRTIEPLLTYLADTTLKDPKAVNLKKKVACMKFISLTYILMDIIPHVSKLSLFFQKENVDLALVQVNTKHCVHDLRKLLTESGPHEQKIGEDLQDGIYLGHQVTSCPPDYVQSAKQKFINKLIDNINERFHGTDIMTAFGVLSMRPLSVLSSAELEIWGDEQIEKLTSHYGFAKTHTWKEGSEEKSTTSPPVIDPEATKQEWKAIKPRVIAHMYPRDNTQNLWFLINKYSQNDYPNLIKLAHLALTCPVHTSGCERGFSIQNSILTSTRNRLNPHTQNMLIRIKAAAKPQSAFDFNAAIQFYRHKKRKIFSGMSD